MATKYGSDYGVPIDWATISGLAGTKENGYMSPGGSDYDFNKLIGISPESTSSFGNASSPSNREIENDLNRLNRSDITNTINDFFGSNLAGKDIAARAAILGGGLAGGLGAFGSTRPKVGYQGGIPKFTAERNMVTAPPAGSRPGAGGVNYGGDVNYVRQPGSPSASVGGGGGGGGGGSSTLGNIAKVAGGAGLAALLGNYLSKSGGINNLASIFKGLGGSAPPGSTATGGRVAKMPEVTAGYPGGPDEFTGIDDQIRKNLENPAPFLLNDDEIQDQFDRLRGEIPEYKMPMLDIPGYIEDYEDFYYPSEGGLEYAKGGGVNAPRYLQGETDGMADKISARIGEDQPAALSHGEFVVPADVVSHLGNGNSDAGAKKLYSMMDKIRQARTGTKKQGKRINPDKFMPGGTVQGYAEGGSTDDYFSVLEERDLSNPRYREYLARQQGLEGSHPEMFAAPIARGLGSLAKTARGMFAPTQKTTTAFVAEGPGSVLKTPIGAPVPEITAADLERFLKAARSSQHIAKQKKHFAAQLPRITEQNLMRNTPRNVYNAFVEGRNMRDLMDERQQSNGMASGGEVQRFNTGGTTMPAGSTGSEQTLASWTGDYIPNMLGKAEALASAPYQQYSGPLTAGASGLQQQAFNAASNLSVPGSVGQAAQTAGDIASKAQNVSYDATKFDNQFKAPELSAATQFTNQFKAPDPYQSTAFKSGTFGQEQAQQYMNPYLQASLNPQLEEARRQSNISEQANKAAMTKAGAFGGGRSAILTAENQRNLGTNLAGITGKGYDTAYQNAMSQFNADQARNMQAQQMSEQSKQFGATQGMTAADMMAKYGMSAQQAQEAARQFNQGQSMTAAQQAAQYGQAANQASEQSRQFGADLGIKGLQTGLQAAQTQGNLGISSGQLGLAQLQEQERLGATQRGIEAEGIAADRAEFERARENPYKMLQFQQSMLQGLPISATNYSLPEQDFLTKAAGGATTTAKLLETLGFGGSSSPKK